MGIQKLIFIKCFNILATCLTESEQNVPSAVTQSGNGNYKSIRIKTRFPSLTSLPTESPAVMRL